MRKRREMPTPRMQALGAQIHALRKQQGLTLQVVAARAGMTHQHLSKIERGLVQAPIETLVTIFDALGVSMPALGGVSADPSATSLHSFLFPRTWRIPGWPVRLASAPLRSFPVLASTG